MGIKHGIPQNVPAKKGWPASIDQNACSRFTLRLRQVTGSKLSISMGARNAAASDQRRFTLSVVLVAPDGVFVPLHARAGPVRDHEEAALEFKRCGEDRVV